MLLFVALAMLALSSVRGGGYDDHHYDDHHYDDHHYDDHHYDDHHYDDHHYDDHDHHYGECYYWLQEIKYYNEHGYKSEEHKYKHEMVPECDDKGNFVPKQCHTFTREDEWCYPGGGECLHFKVGDRWCACVDVYKGMPDFHTLTMNEHELYCDPMMKPCCPYGWVKYGHHGHEYCYKFIKEAKTFVEAEKICQFDHGHLASIDCPETHRFLQELTRGKTNDFPKTWVGATNAVKACFWMWLDGCFFKYEDFYMEKNRERENSCLSINNKFKWAAGCCNQTLPFICSKKTECYQTMDMHQYEYEHH